MDVEIGNRVPWREQHWERIESSYAHAPYFKDYAPLLGDLYRRDWRRLVDLNEYMLQGLLDFLGVETRLVRASALGVRLGDGNVLVDVCRALGITNYLSGAGGNCPHLDESALGGAGIAHRVQRFTHPVYPQLHGAFMPRMAVVDLLFNCGAEAARVIRPTAAGFDCRAGRDGASGGREGEPIAKQVELGAVVWGSSSRIYGLVEGLVNTGAGLFQPLHIWAVMWGVYGLSGLFGGAAAGVVVFAWSRVRKGAAHALGA